MTVKTTTDIWTTIVGKPDRNQIERILSSSLPGSIGIEYDQLEMSLLEGLEHQGVLHQLTSE